MKIIIAPVDFSTTSENAAFFACQLASFYGAELLLYHAYDLPVAIGEFAFPIFDTAEMQKAADHELHLMKERICEKLHYKLAIRSKADLNEFKDGLANLCDSLQPDLVVLGLSGKNPLTKLVVGSNTIKVVHDLKYPVLVVPPQCQFVPIRKIGFACDYDHLVETTPVALLKKIVQDFKAELSVMNVDYQEAHFNDTAINERNVMNNLLDNVKAEFHNINSASVTEGVNWFVDKCQLDMVMIIPKKHTVFQSLFRRSHTKDLMYHTHIPLLCVHQ